ncbi:hypothetical protein N7495_006128 [Penicillium taxi]|uniref:uncharacterized protein n=1 Tax=Penicillium taxi TaxID=168475 RepID=UPI002545725E|nr:uncharacterized protein N7495_006128 [Penicillium taxi]KAJ5894437.1 hypothetical protein N7495_006128 [Penicillium taxi]
MGKEKSKFLSFPRFILPSYPDKRRVGPSTPPSSPDSPHLSPSSEKYLDGHVSYLRCTGCAAHICLTSQIISKGFTGRYGRAYLVSADLTSSVSVSASSSPTVSLPNTVLHEPAPRQLITGAHTVSDVVCIFCESVLGWKYVSAEEESQRYKVGKFILETRRITASSCWESPPSVPPLMSEDCQQEENESHNTEAEFDSQDEDECEDLFAGIWSPGLANRRRGLKIDRRSAMLRIS